MLGFGARMIWRSLARRFRASGVTFLGVAFAVAMLVVLWAIMVGVSDAMVRNSVAVQTGHVIASWSEGAGEPDRARVEESMQGLRTALWRKRKEGLLWSHGHSLGLTLYAVQPERERLESAVPRKMVFGAYLMAPQTMVLGAAVSRGLGARVGDCVEFRPGAGEPLRFCVGGVFETGIGPLDGRTAYVRFEDVPGPASELAVYLGRADWAEAAARDLRKVLPESAQVLTWRQALPEVVQLVALNGICMDIVLVLALLILAFGISNTVFISVAERTREFGILKAMGLLPWQIVVMVLAETLLLVSLAAGVGMGAGVVAAGAWGRFGLDLGAWTSANPHFVASGVIYPRLTAGGVAWPVIVAASCGLLAGFWPAHRAGRINVVQGLRSL